MTPNVNLHRVKTIRSSAIRFFEGDDGPFWTRVLTIRGDDGGEVEITLFALRPSALHLPHELPPEKPLCPDAQDYKTETEYVEALKTLVAVEECPEDSDNDDLAAAINARAMPF